MPCGALTSFLRRSLLLYNFLAVDDIQPFGLIFQRAFQFLATKGIDAWSYRRFSSQVAYAGYVAIDFYIVNVDAELIRGIKVTEGNIFRAGR